MKVSMLIPVYNKAPWLRECLDSVFAQRFRDFEVVAVDDASTDESLAILRSCRDPRLRIVELEQNMGPAGAANAGMDACRGEYIARLDADDLAVPDRLAIQVAYMDANPQVGASGGAVALFGAQQNTWSFPQHNDDCQAQLLFGVPVSQGASIMRRSVLQQHGLRYDAAWPRVGEDWLLWTRMGRVAHLGNVPQVLIHYRRGEQNIAHGRDRIADHRLLLREVFRFFDLPLTDDDLESHLMALRMFPVPPDAEAVRAYHRWLGRLALLNRERAIFPGEAFGRRLDKAWEQLFPVLPRYGTGAALQHVRLGKDRRREKLMYLLKYRINALLGRNSR